MHDKAREKSPEELAVLERLRRLCFRFAEVAEAVDGFGHTSFRVGKKPFTMMGSQQLLLAIKTDPITQEHLINSGRFRRTPYIGQHGWVDVVDFNAVDWEEIEGLIADAYRLVAPKRLLRQLPKGF